MTLSILTERVYTSLGVPISVIGTAQVGKKDFFRFEEFYVELKLWSLPHELIVSSKGDVVAIAETLLLDSAMSNSDNFLHWFAGLW